MITVTFNVRSENAAQHKKKKKERRSKNSGRSLPQTFLGSRLPLQGDGIGNDVGDGEFPDFEGRRENRTLWRHEQSFSESEGCNSTTDADLDTAVTALWWRQRLAAYLQSTSSGHSFVSVQRGAQLLPKEFADSFFDSRDPGSTPHYFHCIYVFLFQL